MRLLGRSMRSQATSTLDMLSRFFSAMADAGCRQLAGRAKVA
jgi:hypothetical protein